MNLFLELRKHGKLAEKRHPMYEKSKFGKFWMYFMSVFWQLISYSSEQLSPLLSMVEPEKPTM